MKTFKKYRGAALAALVTFALGLALVPQQSNTNRPAPPAPTVSFTCPSTAFVGEVVVCDGTASTGVNGQVGWSTRSFTDGSAPVDWNFGDGLGAYSRAEILKSPHVYLASGTYTIALSVRDSAGIGASSTTTITISDIPAASGGGIQTLVEQGSPAANSAALQVMVNAAYAANTVPQEVRITNGLQLTGQTFLPAATGTSYVTIRPVDVSWVPNGFQRVTPSLSASMPKFTAPHGNGAPLHVFGVGRRYLRVVGMEFNKPLNLIMSSLIVVGSDGSSSPSAYNQLPDHVIFDHCYFHGNLTDDTTRGMLLYATDLSVLNSYFANFHDSGADSQAIGVIDGKRYGFVNNYLEGLGENIMVGGAGTNIKFSATASGSTPTSATLSSVASLSVGDAISFSVAANRGPWSASIVRSIAGTNVTFDQVTNQAGTPSAPDTTASAVKYGSTPQDIFVARNYLYKNPDFRVGSPTYNGIFAVVKNSFELKNAMRVVLVGNMIENMWGNQGQDGHTVLFTPRNQTCYLVTQPRDPVTCPEQTNPWVPVRDVQFSYNWVRNIPDFVNVLGTDNLNPPGTGDESGPSGYAQYINVRETVVDGVDPAGVNHGQGQLVLAWPGGKNITFSHLTMTNVAGGQWVTSSDAPVGHLITNTLIVNNIAPHQYYGVFGDGKFIQDFMPYFFPDGFVRYNVLTDDFNSRVPNGEIWAAPQAGPTYFLPTINSGIFVNRAAGDYHLVPGSPFKAGGATPAADGRDIGVSFDEVVAATLNTISGNWTATGGNGSVLLNGRVILNGKAVIQ